MKQSKLGRMFTRVLAFIGRFINPSIEGQTSGKHEVEEDGALLKDILRNPAKQMAVLNYLESNEKIERYYNARSESTQLEGEEDPELSDKARVNEVILDDLEDDLSTNADRLEDLGIDPRSVDRLMLTSDQLTDLISAVRPDTAGEDGLRLLPILKIHDTDFYVDLEKLEFRQVDNPKNIISFRDVQDNWTYTSVLYDPKTKNVFQGTEAERATRQDIVLVELPARTQLDTQYWADRVAENARAEYLKARSRRDETTDVNTEPDKKQLDKNRRRAL